jgi:general secretion pathway protein G
MFGRSSRLRQCRTARRKSLFGFTLLEILLAFGVLGVLVAIGLPSYRSYVERAKNHEVIVDITVIAGMLNAYKAANGDFPATLADIGWTKPDRWGNHYYYLDMAGASVGQKRKDRSLHPLNSDFDLYSAGPDGKTTTPLTAKISQDDIIRANDGAFIGVAKDY